MPECARFQSSAYIPKVGDIIHADSVVSRKPCTFVYIVCRVTPSELAGHAPVLLAAPLRNPIASDQHNIAKLPAITVSISIGSMWHLAGSEPRYVR